MLPTTYATGTMTTCAATMHADISAVPTSLLCKPNSWPTSGSMAALAKWNMKTAAAKIIKLRLRSSTANPDGCACCCSRCLVHAARHVIVDRIVRELSALRRR